MGHRLRLVYSSSADLHTHLFEHTQHGALLLPVVEPPEDLRQYDEVTLEVEVGEERRPMRGEVLQVIPGSGVVVHLTEAEEAAALVENAPLAEPAIPPAVVVLVVSEDEEAADEEAADEEAVVDDADGDKPARPAHDPQKGPLGSSPISWSFEKLQAEWPELTPAERIRVARFGKRPARMMILKGLDKTLHVHVMSNPGLSADEVAMMAAMTNLDPNVLKRIATSTEWVRQPQIARNLICNPKLNLPLVNKILKYLSRDELTRLTKKGRVRQSVKQAIIKKIGRGR